MKVDLIELASIAWLCVAAQWILFRLIQAMETSAINQARPTKKETRT